MTFAMSKRNTDFYCKSVSYGSSCDVERVPKRCCLIAYRFTIKVSVSVSVYNNCKRRKEERKVKENH